LSALHTNRQDFNGTSIDIAGLTIPSGSKTSRGGATGGEWGGDSEGDEMLNAIQLVLGSQHLEGLAVIQRCIDWRPKPNIEIESRCRGKYS
jgi:hypothetical protein